MSEENNNDSELNLRKILSGKNVVFLLGSGASMPAYKTLKLSDNSNISFEDLVSSASIDNGCKKLLYLYFYKETIFPMYDINKRKVGDNTSETFDYYKEFIINLISFLRNESNDKPRRATIFTTNYDLMAETVFQNLSEQGIDCYFNDGGFGFIKRVLNTQNYDISVSRVGAFSNYKNEMPVINLIKMHGSISWKKSDDKIIIDYDPKPIYEVSNEVFDCIIDFSSLPLDINGNLDIFNKQLSDIYNVDKNKIDDFIKNYKNLMIVRPDKGKFSDTVFQLQYYQQLRNLSYELEKENTVLVVLGFSFQDEHIRDIVKRSLNNPTLKVIVITYSSESKKDIEKIMGNSRIDYYPDFNIINKEYEDKKGNFPYLNSLF